MASQDQVYVDLMNILLPQLDVAEPVVEPGYEVRPGEVALNEGRRMCCADAIRSAAQTDVNHLTEQHTREELFSDRFAEFVFDLPGCVLSGHISDFALETYFQNLYFHLTLTKWFECDDMGSSMPSQVWDLYETLRELYRKRYPLSGPVTVI